MPHQQPRRSRLALADTPNAVALARLHTADVLVGWGVSSEVAETAKLLVSELATNAVRHSEDGEAPTSLPPSQSGVETFELLLEVVSGAVRLSVWDRDPRPPVLKEVGVDAMGGRGIFIVAAMSTAWGYYPARSAPGKVVWAEIAIDAEWSNAGRDASVSSPGLSESDGLRAPEVARADPNLIGRVLVGIKDL
ncbi:MULTISPECIES: ATP-binding protein [unclassified Streptomyces]|uniref:ATP-binding protein n=1 Tax=unclassified Streptomyces TaxID=2593676 RepID=UPI002ED42FE1|nr:ATP-binding protein [Streptomyces sp. NBC_00891]WSY08633.1 ATP-binding protein [Streptomyces sp. NBC_00890]WSZ10256.1 ATP-binding protein [Streptomyces sp. NBC_00869]WSZ22241.1 ATP-binding protein [Streptomyces sp. NBC_00870]